MKLHSLSKITDKKKKIIGRGYGSGKGGHTVGRGSKGQKARSSSRLSPLFEGGQNPLYKRLPHKNGFRNPGRVEYEIVHLDDLNIFDNNAVVESADLLKTGLVEGKSEAKVLDRGEITKKINLIGIKCSKGVIEKIEKQGGSVK